MKKYGLLFLKYSFYLFIFFLLVSFSAIGYFLYKNDAPILFGKVDHSILYKNDLSLDIYYPTKKVYPTSPVLIYLHGGAWIMGSKQSINNARFNKAFNFLRRKGYTIITADYTLGEYKKPPFPASVQDIYDLLTWIKTHSSQYNLDINNVGILGESAGAHLALLATYSNGENFNKKKNIPVKYLIDVYGPSDLKVLYKQQAHLLDSITIRTKSLPDYMENHLDLTHYLFSFDPNDSIALNNFSAQYSPVNYLQKAPKIPVLIIHGTKDEIVPENQSFILQDSLKKYKIPHTFHSLQGVNHAFREATQKQKNLSQKWIEEFAIKHYQKN